MSKLIYWIAQTTPTAITLSVALISAAVALVVATLTQLAMSRRARRELLTKKLEELLLLVNEAISDLWGSFKEVQQVFFSPEHSHSESIFEQQVRNLELQKKMVVYIKLHFPRLDDSFLVVSNAQERLNALMSRLYSPGPLPDSEMFDEAIAHYGRAIASFAEEIVSNKELLIDPSAWRRKYRRIDVPPAGVIPFRKVVNLRRDG